MDGRGSEQNLSSDTKKPEQSIFKGIPASSGIAIGQTLVLEPENIISPVMLVDKNNVNDEIEKLKNAIVNLNAEFSEVLDRVQQEASNISAILETNLFIINDPILFKAIESRISEGFTVESAISMEFDKQKNFFKHSKDEILRERAVELEHIKKRLLQNLRQHCFIYENARNKIVVAQSLTPTDLVNFRDVNVLAIITEVGGIASHVSILSRTFDIPAVIGVKDISQLVKDNQTVIVDGFSGNVVCNPKKSAIADFIKKRDELARHKEFLGKLVKLPAETSDKKIISLRANIDRVADMQNAVMAGAEGSGLVRTESLIIALNHIPDEEEQLKWYKEIADIAYPATVTIRAFDIGSDKYTEGIPHHEENPALGFRGIRYLLSRTSLFKTQIKAVLKASVNKNIKLMLPMITNIKEVNSAKLLIEECKTELANEGIGFDKKIPIGIMIETPGAALIAHQLASIVDFFSIGTNDLTQYTLASDRTNELVSDVYDAFHPAVLKLIKIAVDAANSCKIPIGLCGELASHSAATVLLIGMGISELSVAPSVILEMKDRIRNINYEESIKIAENILKMSNSSEILSLLEND